jgi:hypothetical protein
MRFESRLAHDDKSGPLEVLDKPLRDNRGHDLAGVAGPFAAGIPQGEGDRVGDIVGSGGHESVTRLFHVADIASRKEQRKNKLGR